MAIETFDGASGALGAPDWTQQNVGTSLNRNGSGKAQPAATGAECLAVYGPAVIDEPIILTLGSTGGGDDYVGIACFVQGGPGGTTDWYSVEMPLGAADININLFVNDGFVNTRIAWNTPGSVNQAIGDKLEVIPSMVGADPHFEVFYTPISTGTRSAVGTYTDTGTATPPVGSGFGVFIYAGTATTAAQVETFEGGSVATNTSPDTPTCSASATGATTADLTSSAFSDSDVGDTHAASQWQVTTAADTTFASPVVDSAEDAVNLVAYSATGLTASTNYIARVRHKDDSADAGTEWSAWSAASTQFTTSASDTTAPVLSSPTATETGGTTADGSVSTDEGNGTLYWVVTTSATQPSAVQIQAGQDHAGAAAVDSGNQVVSGTGVQNVNATGLTAATTYWFHYQHRDAATNDSNRVFATFTTASAPTATIDSPTAGTISEGMTITLDGTSTAGTGAITLRQWSSNVDGVLGTGDTLNVTLSGTNASPVSHTITFLVEDDNTLSDTDTVLLTVGTGGGSGFDAAAYAINALGGIR